MSKKDKCTKDEFLKMFNEERGILWTTIEKLKPKCSNYMVKKWKETDSKFLEEYNNIKENTNNYVVSQLMRLIDDGNAAAIFFYLKCRCNWRENKKVEISTEKTIDVDRIIEELKGSNV